MLSAVIAKATTVVVVLTNGASVSIPIVIGAARVTQVIAVSDSGVTNNASFQLLDAFTNWLAFTNVAYTNIITYGTNQVSSWTNFYGVVNSVTNTNIVDVANTVAATTNFFPARIQGSAPTNGGSIKFDNVNYYFSDGVWGTNTGAGKVTLTLTYQQ